MHLATCYRAKIGAIKQENKATAESMLRTEFKMKLLVLRTGPTAARKRRMKKKAIRIMNLENVHNVYFSLLLFFKAFHNSLTLLLCNLTSHGSWKPVHSWWRSRHWCAAVCDISWCGDLSHVLQHVVKKKPQNKTPNIQYNYNKIYYRLCLWDMLCLIPSS